MRVRGIDAGGSETRVATSPKNIMKVPSVTMEISPDSSVLGHIIEDKTLDFVFKKCPASSLVGRRFVKGQAMDQYRGNTLVCDNEDEKVLQEITYINILYGIARDFVLKDINDESVKVGVCIPAAEYYDQKNDRIAQVKQNLAGETAVYFPLLDRTVRFDTGMQNIGVTAEGVVAAYRFKTDRDFVLRDSVVVDIGYRSTDITLLRKYKPIGDGAASRPIGGINLEAAVQSKLERDNIFVKTDDIQSALYNIYIVRDDEMVNITDYIYKAKDTEDVDYINYAMDLMAQDSLDVSRGEVEVAVSSHYVAQGNHVVNITKYVHEAKEYFIDAVYKAVADVANARMINVKSISNVLCVGRPFNGELSDTYCLVNMLEQKFSNGVKMYTIPDAGVANVTEIIKMMAPDEV